MQKIQIKQIKQTKTNKLKSNLKINTTNKDIQYRKNYQAGFNNYKEYLLINFVSFHKKNNLINFSY